MNVFSKWGKRYTIKGLTRSDKRYQYGKKSRSLLTVFKKLQELKRKGFKNLVIYDERNKTVYNDNEES